METTKTYRVTKRVVIEYTWFVEGESAADARAYAEDIGEPAADELTTTSETFRVRREEGTR